LIGTGSNPIGLFIGYVVGGAIMVLGGIVELLIGIKAEGKSLETVTKPLTSTDEPPQGAPPATSPASAALRTRVDTSRGGCAFSAVETRCRNNPPE
jgi:hypothetical protein